MSGDFFVEAEVEAEDGRIGEEFKFNHESQYIPKRRRRRREEAAAAIGFPFAWAAKFLHPLRPSLYAACG